MKTTHEHFGNRPDGQEVDAYTIENDNGYSFRTMTHGATLISFKAPDYRSCPKEWKRRSAINRWPI